MNNLIQEVLREEIELLKQAEAKNGMKHTERVLVEAELRLFANKVINKMEEKNEQQSNY